MKCAIEHGYRHIDCAIVYGNQREIGEGIKAANVPRSELFIVSKLWNTSHRPGLIEKDLDATLEQLGIDYLDSYLIHFPVAFVPSADTLQPVEPGSEPPKRHIDRDHPGIVTTWKEMIRIWRETNKVRSIGVSNFGVRELEIIIDATGVVPAFNQIECHPGVNDQALFDLLMMGRQIEGNPDHRLFAHWKQHHRQAKGHRPTRDRRRRQQARQAARAGLYCLVCSTRLLRHSKVRHAQPYYRAYPLSTSSNSCAEVEANFDDFVLSEEDFNSISAAGRANPVRGNVPAGYRPAAWPINFFDTDEERQYDLRPW